MPCVVAVRPENIVLRANGDAASAVNSFPARVIEGHFHGTQTTYAIETLGHRLEAIELGTVPRFNAQDAIRVVIPPDHSWVFPQPGARCSGSRSPLRGDSEDSRLPAGFKRVDGAYCSSKRLAWRCTSRHSPSSSRKIWVTRFVHSVGSSIPAMLTRNVSMSVV